LPGQKYEGKGWVMRGWDEGHGAGEKAQEVSRG